MGCNMKKNVKLSEIFWVTKMLMYMDSVSEFYYDFTSMMKSYENFKVQIKRICLIDITLEFGERKQYIMEIVHCNAVLTLNEKQAMKLKQLQVLALCSINEQMLDAEKCLQTPFGLLNIVGYCSLGVVFHHNGKMFVRRFIGCVSTYWKLSTFSVQSFLFKGTIFSMLPEMFLPEKREEFIRLTKAPMVI